MWGKLWIAIVTGSTLTVLSLAIGLLPAAETKGARLDLMRTAQATETQNEKASTPTNGVAAETPASVVDDRDVEGILGKSIVSSAGETMGRIVDVIVGRSGQVRGAVIDFGGFLGVGSRKIAVEWSALRFNLSDKPSSIAVDLTKDQLRVAPEYKAGEPVVILGAATPPTTPSNPLPAQDK